MPAVLDPIDGGPVISLSKPVLLVGRQRGVDVYLNSKKVSRRHCCIIEVGRDVFVRDLSSANGVHVNGQPVRESRLQVGDELRIGQFRWRLASGELPPKATRQTDQLKAADAISSTQRA